jgi:protein SCO1/2
MLNISVVCLVISFSLAGCGSEPQELPFYSGLDLTPQWLSTGSRTYKKLPSVERFNLTDQNSRAVSNETLAGKVYVANFFFSTCTNICPTMRTNLTHVQDRFMDNDLVRIVSHSIVPEYDDPDVLSRYGQVNNVIPEFWHLLTGPKEEITELALTSYFVDLSDITGDGYAHTENLVLVDTDGHVRGVYNGTLAFEVENLIADIALLVE